MILDILIDCVILSISAAQKYTCYTSSHEPYLFTTFDGRSVTFDGDCKYLLSGTAYTDGYDSVPPFEIYLKRQIGGKDIEYIETTFGDSIVNITLRIMRGNVIKVSLNEMLPE